MKNQTNAIFHYQLWQWLSAFILIVCLQFIISTDKMTAYGLFLNIPTTTWLWLAITVPILHQLYVWFVWRLELYKNYFSNHIGTQKSFKIYKVGFSILFLSRLVFIVFLSISNRDTLQIKPFVSYSLLAFIIPVVVYLFYSVIKYFTVDRAFGIDHFIKNYNEPYIKKGIFRFTSNGMYIFGLMILYLPGLILLSKAALLVAAFNHIYIWAHYFCTEKPDMKKIYQD